MPRSIDTMNGLGEGFWGKPQFHQVDRTVVYKFLERQVLEDYKAGGGKKKLTRWNIENRISRNPIAKGYLSATVGHHEANDDEAGLQRGIKETTRLLTAKKALPHNIFSQATVSELEDRLKQQDRDLGVVRVKILRTNTELPLQFQEDHVWGEGMWVREMVRR